MKMLPILYVTIREIIIAIIIIEGLGAIRAQVKNFNISLQAKTPIFRMPRFNGLQTQVVHALG